MTLRLYEHPFSSYCQKARIAFFETGTPFESIIVDFGDPQSRAAFERIWPVAKMPVLVDLLRGEILPESSIVIEYLDQHYQGAERLIPTDQKLALKTRL